MIKKYLIICVILLSLISLHLSCGDNTSTVSEKLTNTTSDYGLVKDELADVRMTPDDGGEMATQAVMGEHVKILEEKGEWANVELIEQYNYQGWIKLSSILQGHDYSSKLTKIIVTSSSASIYLGPSQDGSPVASLLMGTILGCMNYGSEVNGFSTVIMPDGRVLWIKTSSIIPYSTSSNTGDGDNLIKTGKVFEGIPYYWGGMSSLKGIDCSGFTHMIYRAQGIKIHRDADLQFYYDGTTVDNNNLQKGDLLFFNNSSGDISHVGMYIGNNQFIHASSKYGRVLITNLSEYASIYRGAKRIIQNN